MVKEVYLGLLDLMEKRVHQVPLDPPVELEIKEHGVSLVCLGYKDHQVGQVNVEDLACQV